MTLPELLQIEALNLSVLTTPPPPALELRDVRFLELPEEASRFAPGALALTTGLWMGRHQDRQRTFAAALAENQVTALGLRVGVVVPRMPDELLNACHEHGITAFQIPATVTLEAVARTMTARQNLPLEVVQRELARTLEAGSEPGMLQRLEQLIDTPIVMFAPWGHEMHNLGATNPAQLWNAMQNPGDADRIVETADGVLQSLTVRSEGRTRAVLICNAPNLIQAGRIRPALEFARYLLEVGAPGRREAINQERLVRGGLLRELLLDPWDAELSPVRLQAFGFDQDEPITLAIIEVQDTWARTRTTRTSQLEFRRFLDDLRRAGEEYFQTFGAPSLTGTLSSAALIAWQTRSGETQFKALHDAILKATPQSDVRLGVSRSHEAQHLPAAQREAQFALRAVLEPRGALHFAQMDALNWVAATGPEEALRAIYDSTLGAIRAKDTSGTLEHTLRTYLEQNRNQTRCAVLLEIHLNTLRYRLKRIEEIIGANIDATVTLGRLQLALIAAKRFE